MSEVTFAFIGGLAYTVPAFVMGFLIAARRHRYLITPKNQLPPVDLKLVTLLDGQQAIVTPVTLTSRERQLLEQMWKLTHAEEKG